MTFGLSEHYYLEILSIFRKYPKIKSVRIFGSRAKGTATSASDFDLAVFAPELTPLEFSQLWNALDELPLVFKLDVLHWDTLPNATLRQKILDEGKPFYPPM